MEVYWTESAMLPPKGRPRMDDTIEMIEHMRALGLIQLKPAIFSLHGKIFAHPRFRSEFQRRMSEQLDRDFLSAVRGSPFGLGL